MLFNAGFRSENPDELMTIVRIRGSPFLKSGLRICALRTTFQKWASRTLIINYIESVIFLREAEMDFPWDCLIFHDVDLLPLNDTNPYSCSKAQYYHALRLLSSLAVNSIIRTFLDFNQDPLLMASRQNKWKWKLPYANYFGGVATVSVEQYKQVIY